MKRAGLVVAWLVLYLLVLILLIRACDTPGWQAAGHELPAGGLDVPEIPGGNHAR